MHAMETISCIIPTRNRPEMISRAVASVLANDHGDFTLTVVDQSATAETAEALAPFRSDERFRLIHSESAGRSAALNEGIRQTAGEILAFTDDDCAVPKTWLDAIESAFGRNPDADYLYGQTLAAPELLGQPGVIPALAFRREEKLGKAHRFRIFGMGANVAMRRGLIDRLGGFDEALSVGGPLRSGEDFDFQYRAYLAGAVCLLAPEISVFHYGLRKPEEWPSTVRGYAAGDGAFYLKHVRCGDAHALLLLAGHLGRLLAREALNPIRRKESKLGYLQALFSGMRRSLTYGIDRRQRIYTQARH